MTDGQDASEEPVPPTSVHHLLTGSIAKNAIALGEWSQGDIISPPDEPLALPFTWVQPPGNDAITGTKNPSTTDVKPFYSNASTSLLVVASQTCDVSGADTGKQHPIVMAALLTPATLLDPSIVAAARQGRADYLIESIYKDPSQPSVSWLVDLRMLVPVSKGLLLKRKPGVSAFSSDGLMLFAAALAHKFGRAAIDDVLVTELPKVLNDHVLSVGPRNPVFVDTEEVRLQVFPSGPLAHAGVGVIVIVDPGVKKRAMKVWTGWESKVETRLKSQGFHLRTTRVETANTLKAVVYRETTGLRIPALGPARWI